MGPHPHAPWDPMQVRLQLMGGEAALFREIAARILQVLISLGLT